MGKKKIWIVIAIFVSIALFYYFWSSYRNSLVPDQQIIIEQWLKDRGYEIYRPFRNDWPPGAVIKIEGSQTFLTLSSDQLLSNQETYVSSSIPDVTFSRSVKKQEKGEIEFFNLEKADLESLSITTVNVKMEGLKIISLPLYKLQEAVNRNERLKAALKREDQTLFVIAETVQAEKISIDFRGVDGGTLKEKLDLKKVFAKLRGNFKTETQGTLISKEQVFLGFKPVALSLVATALGSGDQKIEVRMISLKQLQRHREQTRRLYSNYQIFGLIFGLGNYPHRSERAGGELPGALASARLVANKLGKLAPADKEDHVRLVLSETIEEGFDRYKRKSKSDLVTEINKFVEFATKKVDTSKQSVVFFYYFGHGLAEGENNYVYLVPEAFEDQPDQPVHALSDDLIHVGWIRDQLLNISDQVILLIDACRSFRQPEVIQKENLLKLGPLDQLIIDVNNIVAFASGIFGPSPMLFGSPNGTAAPTIPYFIESSKQKVGPLAIRFHTLLEEILTENISLTTGDFLERMQDPLKVNSWPSPIRAYTAFRKDFREELPSFFLVSTIPQEYAIRTEPYTRSTEFTPEEPRYPTFESGASLKKLNPEPFKGIIDFVYHPTQESFIVLDNKWNLWRWNLNDDKRILLKKDLHFPCIGGTDGVSYLQDALNHELFYSRVNGQFNQIRKNSYIDFFGQGYKRRSLIAIEPDGTIGTPDPIYRLQGSQIQQLFSFDVDGADLFDLIEWKPKTYFYTALFGRSINRLHDGVSEHFSSDLQDPGNLSATDKYLYCISKSGRFLYRFKEHGNSHHLDLFDIGLDDVYIREPDQRGFYVLSDNKLYLSAGSFIFEIDISKGNWQRTCSGK